MLKLAVFVSAVMYWSTSIAAPMLTPENLSFRDTYQFTVVHVDAKLENTVALPITIDKIVPVNAKHASPNTTPTTIPVGGSTDFSVDIPVEDGIGMRTFYFDVYTNGSSSPTARVAVRGFVDWLVDPASTDIDLGNVSQREGVTRTLPISVRPGTAIHLLSIQEQGREFDSSISKSGEALEIHLKKSAPWGIFSDRITVTTDNNEQKKIAFHIKGDVRGNVVPSQNPVDFGLVRSDQSIERILRLEDVSGKPLKVGSVSIIGARVSARTEPCSPSLSNCANVRLRLLPQRLGQFKGVLRVTLPDYKQVLPVAFGGILVDKFMQVKDLNKEIENSKKATRPLISQLENAVRAPREMAVPSGAGPLLQWKVKNEAGIYGYEIYRAETEGGMFSRCCGGIIPRLTGEPQIGSIYRVRDTSTVPGKAYWYYIQTVYESGKKQKLAGAQKIIAK